MIDLKDLAAEHGSCPLPVAAVLVVTGISALSGRIEPLARYLVGGQTLAQLKQDARDNYGYRIELPSPSKKPRLRLEF